LTGLASPRRGDPSGVFSCAKLAGVPTGVRVMVCLELPNGTYIDFETVEGLFSALEHIRDRKPIIIRSEKDGVRQVLWAPEDDR